MKNLILPVIALFLPLSLEAREYPFVTGKYDLDFNFEKVGSYKDTDPNTEDSKAQLTDIYLESNPAFYIHINEILNFETSWRLQTLKTASDDRLFEDQGLALEEFYFKFYDDQAEFLVGKMNPAFGMSWDTRLNSGIWGDSLGKEYRLIGKLGVAIKAKIDLEDYGKHLLSLHSFYNDNSGLNDTLITRRDGSYATTGRAADGSGLSSYTLNAYGENFYDFPGLFYNFSFRSLEAGKVDFSIDEEEGYSLGIGIEKEVLYNLKIIPFIEYAIINNLNTVNNYFGPEQGDYALPGDYEFMTMMLVLKYKNWSFNMNKLDKDFAYFGDFGEDLLEYSSTYQFKNGLKVSLGRKTEETSSGAESSSLGIKFSLAREF